MGKDARLAQTLDKFKLQKGLTTTRVHNCKGEVDELRSEQEKLVALDKQIDRY